MKKKREVFTVETPGVEKTMETPIQELIKFMNNIAINKGHDEIVISAMGKLHTHILEKATVLLEKEKEVISDAYYDGYGKAEQDESADFEGYYIETFKK